MFVSQLLLVKKSLSHFPYMIRRLRVRMFLRGKFGMRYPPISDLRGRYTGHPKQRSDLRGMLYIPHPLLSFDLRGKVGIRHLIISDLRGRYIVMNCLRLREMFYLTGRLNMLVVLWESMFLLHIVWEVHSMLGI